MLLHIAFMAWTVTVCMPSRENLKNGSKWLWKRMNDRTKTDNQWRTKRLLSGGVLREVYKHATKCPRITSKQWLITSKWSPPSKLLPTNSRITNCFSQIGDVSPPHPCREPLWYLSCIVLQHLEHVRVFKIWEAFSFNVTYRMPLFHCLIQHLQIADSW